MNRILLVADVVGWIFERHCNEIKKRLSHKYHIDIAFCRGDNIRALESQYDLVYVLDPMPINYPPKQKNIMGLRAEFLYRDNPLGPSGLYEKGWPGHCASIKDKCEILHVVNRNMLNVFKGIVTDKPLMLVQHGVDETCFDRSKFPKKDHPFTIGFSGRSNHPNQKGVDIAMAACKRTNTPFFTAQYGKGKLTKDQMPEFYTNIDAYVCLSLSEGLNNSTMEAGLMGIPTISTRSGAAEEMIRNGENGLMVDRNVDAVAEAIEKLKDDKYRKSLGDAMHEEIKQNWTWAVKIKEFEKMFDLFFEMKG